MEMAELLKLEDNLTAMGANELYTYATEKYPDVPNMGMGKKKLVVRRILNHERNKMNKEESTD
ncbi:hypothetical protein [Methanococcoides burtonii]|uniref:Uncharacterized protein n=1 Tax=Methanococcoides burtonii (strain DSM 6242 / NBRC 107633 / OCM 468 / ACE-M) TaxID=259564 RepID=Q12UM8_METBU|nr:hypothetical protein [Methanococcoides burtonii]ABE52848.1 Hypothetical protein Mbur_1968 [Methanococcoides burtonii DSM 6242]